MAIPKTIHYCWFGGKPLPTSAKQCISSWKKYCPDYEIKEWNESNFDVNMCSYTKEAYKAQKWAFVSDYARFYILYHEGGIYFDVDVEVVRGIDKIVEAGPFMGFEDDLNKLVAPGLGMGAEPHMSFYNEVLEYYNNQHFYENGSYNLTTVVERITDLMIKHGLNYTDYFQQIAGITIYPKEYFNPTNMTSGIIELSDNTVSIHHYAATWVDGYSRFRGKVFQFIYRHFGNEIAEACRRLFGRNK